MLAMKSSIHFSVLILAVCCTAGVHASDDIEAALQDMLRVIATPQVVIDYCIKEYPGYAEDMLRMPEVDSRSACAKYGEELTNGGVNVSNLEKMFAVQLKLIRGKDAVPGSF